MNATVAAEEHRNVDAVDGGFRSLDAVSDPDEPWPQEAKDRIAVQVVLLGRNLVLLQLELADEIREMLRRRTFLALDLTMVWPIET